jgi:hypothetical protein
LPSVCTLFARASILNIPWPMAALICVLQHGPYQPANTTSVSVSLISGLNRSNIDLHQCAINPCTMCESMLFMKLVSGLM